jgi:hypothetical protein
MTRSNRLLNRIILALVGLSLIAVAVWVANRYYPVVDIDPLSAPTGRNLWIVAGIALGMAILSLVWILTRGRGRTSSIVTATDDTGSVSIDARVAADLIAHDLAALAEVVSVSSTAFRTGARSTPAALELRVVTRRSADLPTVVRTVTTSVEQFDAALETRLPVLLHVASGVRASFAREQRVR